MFKIREPFVPEDARVIAQNIRPEDARELKSMGCEPFDNIMQSLARSRYAWTGTWENVPVCIFGLVPLGGETGLLWLLGAVGLERCKLSYFKACRRQVKGMLELYPCLVNAVDGRYTRALKWIERLGGKWKGEVKAQDGTVFKIFVIRREDYGRRSQ